MVNLIAFVVLWLAPAIGVVSPFPTDTDWIPFVQASGTDVQGDVDEPEAVFASPIDIVGSAGANSLDAQSFYFFDSSAGKFWLRIRLDGNPTSTSASPSEADDLRNFRWGFIIDSDADGSKWEYAVFLDMVSLAGRIVLCQNTIASSGGLSVVSDACETNLRSQYVIPGFNARAVEVAWGGTSNIGTQCSVTDAAQGCATSDYFLDFSVPSAWLTPYFTICGLVSGWSPVTGASATLTPTLFDKDTGQADETSAQCIQTPLSTRAAAGLACCDDLSSTATCGLAGGIISNRITLANGQTCSRTRTRTRQTPTRTRTMTDQTRTRTRTRSKLPADSDWSPFFQAVGFNAQGDTDEPDCLRVFFGRCWQSEHPDR
eukprot:TRINITY_DN8391_c0_g1_i2.p1 TRINITY_DN8391_c0_g1~~TRINITY_DN8391_c0_g1_i2.p1  ORF type:complete len:381 (+),score=47.70 TRINITY_DN8391_c0_g1_i2:25-1143(+)